MLNKNLLDQPIPMTVSSKIKTLGLYFVSVAYLQSNKLKYKMRIDFRVIPMGI